MRRTAISAAVLALGVAGCTHYAAAPARPAQFVADFDARRLNEKPVGEAWTGADLLNAALSRNPQIIEARAKYVAALAAARAAKAPPGPSLTLTAEYADEAPRWGYSGVSDIPLDYGARRGARVTTANLQALQAFYDYGEAIWSVRTALEKARVDLLAARAELALAVDTVNLRRLRFERVRQRVEAGQDARAVQLTAQAEAVNADREVSAAEGRRVAAVADLAKAVGVASAAVSPIALAPVAVAPPSATDVAIWRRDAASSRRDVLRAVADYDIADQALRLEVANQYPAISLGPSYNYDHGVTKLPFSLGLALPPWDLNRHAIDQAEAARVAAGRSLELAQATALAEVDAAAAALATAQRDAARTENDDLAVASRTAASVARSAKAGEADRVDDLAAQGALADTRLALLNARHAAASATADLEDALRRPFDPAEIAVIEAALKDAGRAR